VPISYFFCRTRGIAPPEQLLADGLREGSGGTEKKVRKGVSPVKLLQPVDNEASSPARDLSPDDESFHDRPPEDRKKESVQIIPPIIRLLSPIILEMSLALSSLCFVHL